MAEEANDGCGCGFPTARFSKTARRGELEVSRCGLCQQVAVLQDSHFLPRALYKCLRSPSHNPIVITRGSARSTSKQVQDRFLCHACEDRFNEKGEAYILRQYACPNGQFKLRERLQVSSPYRRSSQCQVYDVRPILGAKIDHYLYFAISVFWRAAARTWHLDGHPLESIVLDPGYQEGFRQYLLGSSALPEDVHLFIFVASETRPLNVATFPMTDRETGGYRHLFYIPGLSFYLLLGREARPYDIYAFNGAARTCMYVSPFRQDSLFQGIVTLVKAAEPSGGLSREP
jgi:hypothetical protein